MHIGDLALIGDRRSAALVARDGAIVWYSPQRFDGPTLFAALLDARAGRWTIDAPAGSAAERRYLEDSGALETRFGRARDSCTVTDWMPAGETAPAGVLCRRFSPAPGGIVCRIAARPDYARRRPQLTVEAGSITIDGTWRVHASHVPRIAGEDVLVDIPAREAGWVVLGPAPLARPSDGQLEAWLSATLAHWRRLARLVPYTGPYEAEVKASLRAIRLLCHEESGGIVAAATTSLPEVPGGDRNWDYRYVWLRDTGMIVSALTRLGGSLQEGEAYLDFICDSRGSSPDYPLAVFTTLDGKAAPEEEALDLAGYLESRPVRVGNGARSQLQLDAFANVLLAAKLIYARSSGRPHWQTVEAIADFIAAHWREPDHGIWEEPVRHQYTTSKVIAACALDAIADFARDEAQVVRWREAVRDIRAFVARHCLTSAGAYGAYAGSEAVDLSAALFPIWAYTAADAPEMLATMAVLEKEHSTDGVFFRRHLECADAGREGVFLAGTLWVAQYWVMRGDTARARRIIDAVLGCASDVGLFPEEADPRTGRLLGNFPQAFVHAALIGAVIDLKGATT